MGGQELCVRGCVCVWEGRVSAVGKGKVLLEGRNPKGSDPLRAQEDRVHLDPREGERLAERVGEGLGAWPAPGSG